MKPREKHEGFPGQRLVLVPRPVVASALQQPLLRHLLPTGAGFYPRAHGHQCTREKGCPEAVFIYCARGDGWCEVAGRKHEVAKDQLLVIPAGTPHVYGAAKSGPWTIHWFHAMGTNLTFYLERLGVTREKPVVALGGDVRLFSLFEDVLEELERGSTLTNLIYAPHSLSHLMGVILQHKEELGHGEANAGERAKKNIEFMKEHLREPLQIARLAAVVNLSRSHYTALFHRGPCNCSTPQIGLSRRSVTNWGFRNSFTFHPPLARCTGDRGLNIIYVDSQISDHQSRKEKTCHATDSRQGASARRSWSEESSGFVPPWHGEG